MSKTKGDEAGEVRDRLIAQFAEIRKALERLDAPALQKYMEAVSVPVVREQHWRARRVPLPFVKDAIAPGRIEDVTVRPQVTFRPTHLVVTVEVAKCFRLVDYRIGVHSQKVAWDSLPLGPFARPAYDVLGGPEPYAQIVQWDSATVECAQDVILSVWNRSDEPEDFEAILWGVIAV